MALQREAAPEAPVGRRERRKQEVRERILAAAEALFQRRGFEATTVDQIAEAADVAQKTFFNHFPTKQAVFEEFANGRLAVFERVVAGERQRRASTRDRLERTFTVMADHAAQTSELVRDLTLHMMRAQPAIGDGRSVGAAGAGREQLSTLEAAIGALLRDGQAQGDVRGDHDVAFLTELIVGAYCMIMIQWAKDERYPVRERLRETACFLGRAISPTEGTE